MKKTLLIALAALALAVSCAKEADTGFSGAKVASQDEFTAYIVAPENEVETKLVLDNDLHLWWNSYGGDPISLFSGNTHSQYVSTFIQYTVENSRQPNYAVFTKREDISEYNLGYTLDKNYAVFPYDQNNTLSADGVLTTNIFGTYHMAAVTKDASDKILYFKALCGYLVIPFYGSGVIDKIVFRGNNGEIIRGMASVRLEYGKDPEVSMLSGGETEIVFENCNWEMQYTASTLRLSLPPVTFTKGFTVVLTDIAGNEHYYRTYQERTIQRNVYNTMDAQEVRGALYSRWESVEDAQASLDELYTRMAYPAYYYSTPDDFGFLANMYSNDVESADLILPDTGYNWFSVCAGYMRSSGYRNYIIRLYEPLRFAREATRIIAGRQDYSSNQASYIEGQARALRAYAYMVLAENLSFGARDLGAACVPVIDENVTDPASAAPASVEEVYGFIMNDLAHANVCLQGFSRSSTAQIDQTVVYALMARLSLSRGNWQEAMNYAAVAAAAFTPASIAEVSVPSFMDISEHNWIWGYDMTPEVAANYPFATTSSWLRSFSENAYSAAVNVYASINNILYDLIPETDVRKGWWINNEYQSPLLDGLTWGEASGNDIVYYENGDKCAFYPYVNVKFGCNPVGTKENAEDMPLVRVEEMLLIQAECAARMGDYGRAQSILADFVCNYRDPAYNVDDRGLSLLDEIWFQRRIELWGEGFGRPDMIRLGKPMVRFLPYKASNVPEYFCFNLPAFDQRMVLPLPNYLLNQYPNWPANYTEGDQTAPFMGEDLRDGVTD
ncbi:MAG: RagB/SusD family nutrient uptake outer membrane protein [Bacteroidales bacterium]|nr:RagB/SusD family nutrient uptake outer membrane protein [Bacteroidales bacterium]